MLTRNDRIPENSFLSNDAMIIGRLPRYFKLVFVGLVIIIFILATGRQRISSSSNSALQDPKKADENQKQWEEVLNNKNRINDNEEEVKEVVDKDVDLKADLNGRDNQEQKLGDFEDNNVKNNIEDEEIVEEPVEPFNEKMPGAFLRYKEPLKNAKTSYCKFNYGFPLDLKYDFKKVYFPPHLGKYSPYRVLYNVTEAWYFRGVPMVTYSSHVTADFANYIPELVRYWDGLVSITAFVPDLDVAFFLEQINQYCACESAMSRVSIHLVTHKAIPFSKKDVYFTLPENCLIQDSSKLRIYKEFDETVVYPVNVCRNVARQASLTKYVMVSDIQLMPSKGLAANFINMIRKYNKVNPKEVFVVPIFEVEDTESIPESKSELLNLLQSDKAVYFHGKVCAHCQRFPGYNTWVSADPEDGVKPLLTVKRHIPYNRWEPIFIGTKADPLYDERLSWEGLQDKMTQCLEMCLQDYNYTILDGAFLVHWPGIKKNKVETEEWRTPYVKDNMKYYQEVIKKFGKTYNIIEKCGVNATSKKLPGMKSNLKKTKNIVKK